MVDVNVNNKTIIFYHILVCIMSLLKYLSFCTNSEGTRALFSFLLFLCIV